jgi:hypothetical protein
VAVCDHCHSVVARGDRTVEDLGKVAAIVETGAVLKRGLTGRYHGLNFELVGRTQMKHSAGGVWDEWYAAFPNGRWGWLAEAQGRFYLTFAVPKEAAAQTPAFSDLTLEQFVTVPGAKAPLVVSETGTATVAAAEGEIPWRVTPGARYEYADLSGDEGAFATLDYSDDPPTVFVGKQVTLDDLGIPKTVRRETWELRQVAAKKLSCPNCGGALDLRVPDKTERVGCPYCGSLLEAKDGDLRFLTKPEELRRKLKPLLQLGAVGTLGEAQRTVIAMLRRSVTVDGVDYFWDEYLLYHPRDGFEWLTDSDGHWNHVRSVPAGDVTGSRISREYNGANFRIFQDAEATVRAVIGECYWKVSIGEKVRAIDYVAPPLMLTREASIGAPGEREVNWSLGEYLTPAEVQQAFQLPQALPSPWGVGPNQPFRHKRVYLLALIFVPLLCILGLLAARSRTVYDHTFKLDPLPPGQKTQVFFSDKFELKGRNNVCVCADMPGLSGGLSLEGDLVREGEGTLHPFVIDMGFWSGSDEDGPWTEGSKHDCGFLSSPGAGAYSLRLEAEPEHPTLSGQIHVKVEQGVLRMQTFVLALLAVLAIPVIVGIYHIYFALSRWKDSEFSPYKGLMPTVESDDD